MADEDVATKAPESDAQVSTEASTGVANEASSQAVSGAPKAPSNTTASQASGTDAPTSLVPGDTPAQTGPSMGHDCTSDRPTPANLPAPTGEMSTLAEVPCYISEPSSYPSSPAKLLLLLTGGTGIESTNNQLQADAYASKGYVVIMPDQFGGDLAPKLAHSSDPMSPSTEPSMIERVKEAMADAAKSFRIDMWLARHGPEKVLPIVQTVLAAAREEFGDAVAAGGGVYGVGYCFGAKYILLLCGKHPGSVKWGQKQAGGKDIEKGEAEKEPELKVGAIAHGTLITKEDIESVKSPVAMVCVDNDNLFPNDVREQGRAALELNAVEFEIQVFKECPHGFAVVGDYASDQIAAAQKEAFDMMAGWLEKY